MYRQARTIAEMIARALAIAGGAVLLCLIVLTCISIIGRALVPFDIGLGPIRGIYDMTEIGMAAAIFAFLPWAQFNEAHARVDLFQPVMPKTMDRMLDLLFNLGMLVVAVVGTWRLYLGMQDKLSFGETTLIAQIPVWQGYAASLVGAVGFIVVAAFCVLRSGRRIAGLVD
ncbi:TRAP transporter small permease [Marivita sp. XM-24bin2]|jgi:TRAP-type C4-dicarboxylate transport system permease small subunit|uniref:TRAP transporter small permease n=1 Tax=unclassified Marivita TaxID=2632480 RepID=UPI000D79B0E5|nr:TRAP transporter small permease [Marivita sp. XM-24bin2]MCR9108930.1 TRAP transporter small permease subunit [Paracoccaceae bacterium]PWL36761.1 MAG: TRAP transporter small permease [Marivita sp. XM-24bin2]